MVAAKVVDWFAKNARDLPWRRRADPYAIWVSEIMLQQTQVKTVIPFFERWMRELPSIESLARAPSAKIHKLWEGLGYYTRVRNLQRAARQIVDEHAGNFPRTFDHVLALPGIGRYTAGAICSIAFNDAAPILDGNVIRVLTRLHGIRSNARDKKINERLWRMAAELVKAAGRLPALNPQLSTQRTCSFLNQGLMELGATVCTPRNARCEACPVEVNCVAKARGWVDALPNLGERAATTARRFVAAVVKHGGRVLVRQREAGVVNAHLWEFPNIEVPLSSRRPTLCRAIEHELGCGIEQLRKIATIKHSITRYRITLEAFSIGLNGTMPMSRAGEWKTAAQIRALPFTSAHRKIATAWMTQKD